jgi:hypothetical protein
MELYWRSSFGKVFQKLGASPMWRDAIFRSILTKFGLIGVQKDAINNATSGFRFVWQGVENGYYRYAYLSSNVRDNVVRSASTHDFSTYKVKVHKPKLHGC